MKRRVMIIFATAVLMVCISSMMVQASWEWSDPSWFTDYYGVSIPSPWGASNHYGLDLTDSQQCPPTEGWVLYQSGKQPIVTYFALYNKYTGVLRLFLYLGNSSTTGEQDFILNCRLENGSGYLIDPAFFLNECGPIAFSLEEKNTEINNDRVSVVRAYYRKWIALDYFVSYDPAYYSNYSNNNHLYLRLDIDSKTVSTIELEGSFEFEVDTILPTHASGFMGLLGNVFGKNGQVRNIEKDVSSLKDTIKSDSDQLKETGESDKSKLGNILDLAASTISIVDPFVGIGLGVFDIIGSFTNFLSPVTTKTQHSYGEGTISLNGTIITNSPIDFIRLGLPYCNYTYGSDNPTFDGKIGLFSLIENPTFTIHRDKIQYRYIGQSAGITDPQELSIYYETDFDFSNPLDHIVVNPESQMELLECKVLTQFIFMCGSPYSYSYLYQKLDTKNGIRQKEFQPYLRDGSLLHVSENGFIMNPFITPYIKLYLKFRHVTDHSIVVEVMRTYKANYTYVDDYETIYIEGEGGGGLIP